MKFVNPIGRTPGSGVQPRACMCTDREEAEAV